MNNQQTKLTFDSTKHNDKGVMLTVWYGMPFEIDKKDFLLLKKNYN